MKIEMNTIYHLPTQAHEDDFLKQAEKQGLRWIDRTPAITNKQWANLKEEYCISVRFGRLDGWDKKSWFKSAYSCPIIEWKIGFTKADMQIGQHFKERNGAVCCWTFGHDYYFNDDLTHITTHKFDIIEVYPLNLTPLWKRSEPKYRVKTELTKEQAEKLGLEFCEEVTE